VTNPGGVSRRWVASAVLIDLDGTLLDTIDDLSAAANAMRVELGMQPLPVERLRDFVGKGAEVLVQRAVTDSFDAELRAEQLDQYLEMFRSHYRILNGSTARYYPGVQEGLVAMKERGLKLACVTNKPVAFTLPLLERTRLLDFFDVIVGGDSLPQRKPHPAPLLHACEGLGVSPGSAVMIGDSINDVSAARAASIPAFVVPYGYNEGQPLQSLPADAFIESLEHANRLITTPRAVNARRPAPGN
jgi:phosphoglycolate phosphatase